MAAVNAAITDARDPARVVHDQAQPAASTFVRTGLAAQRTSRTIRDLRHDPATQTAVERAEYLAGASTMCRLEQRTRRAAAVAG